MTLWRRTSSRLLRGVFLALLVMGLTVKPMLASFCDVHVLGDLVTGLIEDHQSRASHDHANDRDHERGAHDTLHQGSNSAVYADIVPVIILPVGPYGAARIPIAAAEPVTRLHVAGPFRPPIA